MSSWRNPDDLGLEIVHFIHQSLRADAEWCVDAGERGFTWWAGEFAQHVWAEESNFYNSTATFKVHAETDLVRGQGRAARLEPPLMSAMRNTSLCGVVYDQEKDVYRLHSSAYLHADNLDAMKRLMSAETVLQLDEANRLAHHAAHSLQAVPAISEHPQHGLRSQPSPMARAAELFFRPQGQGPSRWLGQPEWKQTEWAMEREAETFKSDHKGELTATYYWPGGDKAVLSVSAGTPHPFLGSGLTMKLCLPVSMDHEQSAHRAVELNSRERSDWMRSHFLGSWCFDDSKFEFECFVPNTSYNADLLLTLVTSMSIRAQWCAETWQ